MAPAPPRGRVEIVEALRGLAALSVMWFHFTCGNKAFLEEGWLKTSGSYGHLGVEVFFVISGFVIPYSLWRAGYRLGPDTGRFLAKRVVRLHPPYLVSLGLGLGLWYASSFVPGFRGDRPDVTPADLFLHLGCLCDFWDRPWVVPVYWTLAIELQFCLFIALTLPLLVRGTPGTRILAVVTLCVGLAPLTSDALLTSWLRLFGFGIIAFQRRAGLIPSWVAAAGWAVLFSVCATGKGPVVATTGLATAMIICFAEVRRFAPLGFLGTLSYSLYLLHVPIGGRVINLASRMPEGSAADALALGGAVTASIAAAWLFHRFVETPVIALASRIPTARVAPAAAWMAGPYASRTARA